MNNILFIAKFPIDPNKGGVQRVTHTLAKEFEKDRRVFFLSLRTKSNPKEFNDDSHQFFFSDQLDFPSKEKELSELINKFKIGYVINQAGILPDDVALGKMVQACGAKFITVHHNCVKCLNLRYREIFLTNRRSKFWKLFDNQVTWKVLKELNRRKYGHYFQKAQDNSDFLLLLSDSFIPELSHYNVKIDNEKVFAIPNPASFKAPQLDLNRKENRILFVGRLTINQKRVDRLMRIYKKLHEILPNWHFDIVGDGSSKRWMQEYCMKNNLDRVFFHGYQDPKPFLEKAKIFTMTSDFEGFGMVLVEAQAYGVVPVAFSSFSSVHEVIAHNKSGIVVPAFIELEYIREVKKLTEDSERWLSFATYAQIEVLKFDVSLIAEQWKKLVLNGYK